MNSSALVLSGGLTQEAIIRRLQAGAFNSSHYIWLLGNLQYFESANGYLFAYTNIKTTTFVALEPLPPNAELRHAPGAFAQALNEFTKSQGCQTVAFIGIYGSCMNDLEALGFQGIKVGRDPWVDLAHCEPTGNKAKGIRSARNHAIKAGVTVEEWSIESCNQNEVRARQIDDLRKSWGESTAIQLEGFLLTINPLAPLPGRRLYVAQTAGRLEGFLIATPVSEKTSFYFEDLIYRPDAPNGVTELLTLEAMANLKRLGVEKVSLGVVSLNDLAFHKPESVSKVAKQCLKIVKSIGKSLYNAEGIELYRKRFQPSHWEDVYMAVRKGPVQNKQSAQSTLSWFLVLFHAVFLFRPSIKISPSFILHPLRNAFSKHPLIWYWAALNLLLSLQDSVRHSFVGTAPTLLPDSLLGTGLSSAFGSSLSWLGYGVSTVIGAGIIKFIERKMKPTFLAPAMLVVFILLELTRFQHSVKLLSFNFIQLAHVPVAPASVIFATFLLGLALHQLRRNREVIFIVVTSLLFVEGSSALNHWHGAAFNPAWTMILGFLIGRYHFELEREHSREVAKGKSPVQGEPAAAGATLIPAEQRANRGSANRGSANQRPMDQGSAGQRQVKKSSSESLAKSIPNMNSKPGPKT